MFDCHSQGLCSCGFNVYVPRGLNCWIDGVKHVSYEQYLSEVGHSLYYVRVQDSVVAEVVDLSSGCYRWSYRNDGFPILSLVL